LKPLNQNIKATPDDEPWNEDNDDFDALDDGTWNLPFRTNYWQNCQGPIWNSGFMDWLRPMQRPTCRCSSCWNITLTPNRRKGQ
jgi:hypothetical protein